MTDRSRAAREPGRGRPPKYGRPSQVVAVTLPREVVGALRRLHSDLGWAIVGLVEKGRGGARGRAPADDVQLVEISADHSLIVVKSEMLRSLPGVQMIALSDTQSFLAFEPGRGMADLEIAVIDRIERLAAGSAERRALDRFRRRLRQWRRDPKLQFKTRSIILAARAR